MLRRLYQRLRDWTDRDEDSRFVGSVLDRSVLFAHGQGNVEAQNELESTREEAQELAETQAEVDRQRQ
jgi:hypothetical protein